MAQVYEPRRTVRVLAPHANRNHEHRTVNIVTTRATDLARSIPERLQISGASVPHETVQAAAAPTVGLPTIYISGYTAPA